MNDYELITLFKTLKKLNSDNKTALLLGINPSFISNIKNKRQAVPEALTIEMARLAGPKITEAWGELCKHKVREKI